jgi:hypothetical protein
VMMLPRLLGRDAMLMPSHASDGAVSHAGNGVAGAT